MRHATTCPKCGVLLPEATCIHGAQSTEPPEPGDLSLCGTCGEVLVFNEDLQLCGLDPDEKLRIYAALGPVIESARKMMAEHKKESMN